MAPGILPDPGLNAHHYGEMIKNRGILFMHTKAVPCPNVQDIESMIHVNHCEHPHCYNGMLQIQAKPVWGYFNNDQLNRLFEVQGEYNENIAIITMSDTYDDDGSQCDLAAFDRLEATADYTKRTYELVESSVSGVDRLKYYATQAHFAMSSSGKEFKEGADFVIQDGKVRWISKNRPGYDQQAKRGEVYTISYYMKPIFYVHHVMKELRASQVEDPFTGEKVAVRLPQHVMVLRELLYPDSKDEVGDQTAKMPRSGALSPR